MVVKTSISTLKIGSKALVYSGVNEISKILYLQRHESRRRKLFFQGSNKHNKIRKFSNCSGNGMGGNDADWVCQDSNIKHEPPMIIFWWEQQREETP